MEIEKKALIVCQGYPLPESHGSPMRTMNFVRAFKDVLKNDCKLDIAFTHGKDPSQKSTYFLNDYRLHPTNLANGFKKYFRRLSHNIPSPLLIFDKEQQTFFRSFVIAKDYDFIFFRYLLSTQLAFSLPPRYKKRIIIDVDDIPSDTLYDMNFGNLNGTFNRVMSLVNRLLLKTYEKRCLSFGAVLFCSGSDMDKATSNIQKQNLFVLPNIFHDESFDSFHFGDGFDNDHVLLFIGSLNYKPNIDGLKWFVESVFTLFKRKFPDAKLLVVGRSPTPEVIRVCNDMEGIELHANVPDVKPFYKKCRVVVVPILSGGGTRIKVLEAALSKRPILSTPFGASGIDLEENTEILLFNHPSEFIDKYHQLATSKVYNSFINKASHSVSANYSEKTFRKSFKKVLGHIDHSISLLT